jgi:hypothetical protein
MLYRAPRSTTGNICRKVPSSGIAVGPAHPDFFRMSKCAGFNEFHDSSERVIADRALSKLDKFQVEATGPR